LPFRQPTEDKAIALSDKPVEPGKTPRKNGLGASCCDSKALKRENIPR
jgi:hypothetical protein